MINLLPPKEKKLLLLEKNRKLMIVLGSLAIISLVCLALILFALKFYILKNTNTQKDSISGTEKQYQTKEFLSFKEIIQKYNEALTKVDKFYSKEIYFSTVLKTILAVQKPAGVHITSIAIDKTKEDNKVKVTLVGMSDTRNNLLAFKESMGKSSDTIKNIFFPANSWIKNTNIDFVITFEIIKNEE